MARCSEKSIKRNLEVEFVLNDNIWKPRASKGSGIQSTMCAKSQLPRALNRAINRSRG